MSRLPKITVDGWDAHGPSYTAHRKLSGFANRRARREGGSPVATFNEQAIGATWDDASAFMSWVDGDDEVWLLNKGHVYELAISVDGQEQILLVDARDAYHAFNAVGGISLIEWGAADIGKLEASAGDDEDDIPSDDGKSADEEE